MPTRMHSSMKRLDYSVYSFIQKVIIINANDFGDVYDAWHTNWVRECFISDAEQFDNVNYAADHYRKYACWQESWIIDCVQEIEARRQLYAPLRNALKKNNCVTK